MATINGTELDDFLSGTQEDDFMHGREGDDFIHGEGGNDTIHGGEGNDTLGGQAGDDLIRGGDGSDYLFWTSDGNDTLSGGEGDDLFELWAFAPFDHLEVHGGEGLDRVFLVGNSMVINLEEGTLSMSGDAGTMSLQSVEHFTVIALEGTVQFTGSSGDDVFENFGNSNDTISGGAGRDFLFGGSMDDLFVFDAAPGEANADVIDFTKVDEATHGWNENDRIALDNDVMAALGAEGDFSAEDERFYAAAGATGGAEDDDRVVYDTDTGNLYYDADGSGAGEAQLIATLFTFGFQLEASDITVI